jgi:hypothetical protein
MVFGSQAFPQELESGQVHGARGDQRMDGRKTLSKPRGQNATKRFAFTQAQVLGAEFEHRGEPQLEMKPALFDFREMRDELGRELAMRTDQFGSIREQILIRSMVEIHTHYIHPDFCELWAPRGRANGSAIDSRRILRAKARQRLGNALPAVSLRRSAFAYERATESLSTTMSCFEPKILGAGNELADATSATLNSRSRRRGAGSSGIVRVSKYGTNLHLAAWIECRYLPKLSTSIV